MSQHLRTLDPAACMTVRSTVIKTTFSIVCIPFLFACGGDEDQDTAREAEGGDSGQAHTPSFVSVTDPVLAGSHAAAEGWLTHGGAYNNQRYSALDQVDRENVHQLVPAWVHQTGLSETFTTTPIVAGDVMYLTTAESQVIALDARTGERIWDFTPHLETTMLCCGPENRGVAAYGDKVYVATLDARVIALDGQSGEVAWETRIADPEDGFSQSMAPLAYNGKVIVGIGGTEFGVRGFVTALDAQSGEEVWRWYTIPEPDGEEGWWGEWKETDPFGAPLQRDIDHEQRLVERYGNNWRRGGGAVETTPAYDPASRTLYLVVGNPSPALDGVVRPGDNLYTGSIIALDSEQGTLKWYMQYLPHDVWDLSGGSAPVLVDVNGRRLVAHAGKTGWIYLVDAAGGQPLLRSDNIVPQEGLFTRPTEEGVRIAPGANGGASDGSPVSYSPKTGLAYVTGLHQPMVYRRSYQPRETGRMWIGGSFRHIPEEPQWANLSAVDLATGKIRWQHQLPALTSGGSLVTAGDLLFIGQGNGTFDALDATSGDILWQFQTGAGVDGTPITYMIDGVQYVTVASGGNSHLRTPQGNALLTFTLDENRRRAPRATYPDPSYARSGPIQFDAARQVPAAEAEQHTTEETRQEGTENP